jgi:signal transduction histidine kinase
MTLQGKLTIGSVVLVSLMVGLVSFVDLANEIEAQFEATLERADALQAVVTNLVPQSLNRQRNVDLPQALKDPELQNNLVAIMVASHAILEIAVMDAHHRIVLDSSPVRVGETPLPAPDFRKLVKETGWLGKLRVLLQRGTHYYQLEESKLGSSQQGAVLYVRVIIEPALIRPDIGPNLQKDAGVAALSVFGAGCITFLFSAVVFRPLGRIGRMLDLAARGEFDPNEPDPSKVPGDELEVMASKVSLLGQRLRGAQFEVSDLRGNIDRLLQDLEDAVFIFNRDLVMIFASGSVEKFLGTARATLSGKMLAVVFPPYTTLGLVVAQAMESGNSVRNHRVPLPPSPGKPSGPATVLLSVDLLEGGSEKSGGAGLLVRLRDPEAQRKLGRELQTADRLAALSRVSGGVAHEVKNPLNAILLHVEVARSKLAHGDTDVAPQMEIVSREITRLDRVVKTFLDFTRPVELNFTLVPVEELLAEIVDLARPQAELAKIKVNVQQHAGQVEARVDRDLLKQAFLNVVMNAIQAMPDGGEMGLESVVHGETAEIRVSDTGSGIDPTLRDQIFRLYFTTKKEGSGIGLAMTFRIVQLHDGTIDFTSEPGKGTTFSIRLPIAV